MNTRIFLSYYLWIKQDFRSTESFRTQLKKYSSAIIETINVLALPERRCHQEVGIPRSVPMNLSPPWLGLARRNSTFP